MIYELSYDGYSLGMFPTRTEAMRRASFLPKSRYIVREWEDDAPFLFFDAERHLLEEFDNAENDASPSISAETSAGSSASIAGLSSSLRLNRWR